LALLDVSELAIFGASILVRLADLEQCGAQAHALPVVFDPGLYLPRHGGRQDVEVIAGKPRRCATQGQALAVARIQRHVLHRFVDQRGLGQEFIALGVAGGVALIVEGLFIQTHFAPADHGLPLLVEADQVIEKHPVLAAVQAAMAVVEGAVVALEVFRLAVDIATAEPMVDGFTIIHHAPECTAAHGQLMTDCAGMEATAERCLHLIIAPGIVRAAEVIDVVAALGGEVVADIGCNAADSATAPGKRAVVVDHHLAA